MIGLHGNSDREKGSQAIPVKRISGNNRASPGAESISVDRKQRYRATISRFSNPRRKNLACIDLAYENLQSAS